MVQIGFAPLEISACAGTFLFVIFKIVLLISIGN